MKEVSEILAAMTALETAITVIEARNQVAVQKASWPTRAAAEVEPTKWTREIEAAIGKPEALEALRIQYDEAALTFVTAMLGYDHARRDYMDAISPLCDGIKLLVKVLDDPESNKLPRHLKPAIQALVLRGIAAHRAPRAECDVRSMDELGDRSRIYRILVSAFGVLAGALEKVTVHQPPRYTMAISADVRPAEPQKVAHPTYTTDLVVVGRDVKPFLNRDVDLRNVYMVPFVDCVNSQHPHSIALVEAHDAVDAALKNVNALVKKLRGDQNGSVNERQHASRMLDLMHGAPQGCGGGNIESQVTAQNKRRLDYETVRLQVVMALDELQAAYETLIFALVAAGAETATLLAETQTDERTTVDRKDAVRTAMNNCLAADLYLRRVGREIAELKANQTRDLTLGNGAAALAASYEEMAKQYRY